VAEGTAPTEGAIVFGQVTMSPKTVGAWVDFSRKLMLQSSIDVESMVRNDLYGQVATEIDRAALNGAGTGSEPSGILASTSVGTSTIGAQGGDPTWASIVELESLVAAGNADQGALGYFFNSKTRGKLKTIVKSTSAVAGFIWEADNTVNGYRTFVTNQLPSNLTKGTTTGRSAAIFGNWQDVMIGQWGGLDLLVDPYTASNTGTVRVVALQDVDVAIRRAASFAIAKDYAN
jgi:HK97 family phage major capsid protein